MNLFFYLPFKSNSIVVQAEITSHKKNDDHGFIATKLNKMLWKNELKNSKWIQMPA
jgi:hypothetical protein